MKRFISIFTTCIMVAIIALAGFTLSLFTANSFDLAYLEAKCDELITRMEIKNGKER